MSETISTGWPARFNLTRLARVAILAGTVVVSACSGSGSDAIDPLAPASFAVGGNGGNGGGNSGGGGGNSEATSLATPQPTVVVSGSTVTISWPAVPNAIEYMVVSSAGTTPKTTATSVVYENVPNGSHTAKVRALTTASHNESGFSNDVTFTVDVPGVTPPDEPPAADNTPPVISGPSIIGTLGLNGWYTSDVTVTWTATDAESAVTLSGCSVSVTSDTQGTTYTCTATSAGGTSTASVTIKRDASTPSVAADLAGTMGNNGWYRSAVVVSFDVSANGPSGIGSTTGCATQNVTADGSFSYTCTATSGAGLSSSATGAGKKDSTIPAIVFAGNAGSYTVDQTVSITCSATDATSGIATATCPSASGDAYTFNIGSNVLSASATDNAGNANSATAAFTVSVTAGSLCNLTRRFVSHAGIANSLCVKLNAAEAAAARGNLAAKAGPLNAYVKEVQAQTGKSVSAANAAILISLAGKL